MTPHRAANWALAILIALSLHGGNVYLPTPADLMDDEANSAAFDLLVDGGIVAIALLIIMVGVCAVMGYSWAHLVALLS